MPDSNPSHPGSGCGPADLPTKQAFEICERAAELSLTEREPYIRDACHGDKRLRASVDSLLDAMNSAGDFLETQQLPSTSGTSAGDAADSPLDPSIQETQISAPGQDSHEPVNGGSETLPKRIGDYRILGVLGEGGMGVVYEAEQENPRRRVALKVVRGSRFVDDQFISMFRREADALARLKHPNIAAIHESGRTDDGQHFFAMELVSGETLDEHLKRNSNLQTKPDLRRRLQLFRQICDAVHYAHQRGVIHRDLKPSNIIVAQEGVRSAESSSTAVEPKLSIKILDFGLARITDTDIESRSLVSEIGVIKGTLPYMSPEQARGNPEEIDVRTDVYALGVMLYEMIAGRRPYKTEDNSLVEAVRVICEERPSPLDRTLSGAVRIDRDVATIAGKALEKEPDRRYGSAAELSGDVERYLDSQPILARPASASYQIRKLVERNKVPSALVAALLLSIVVFGILMTGLFRRSEANLERALIAEQEAAQEAETSSRVAGFLEGLFRQSNPAQSSNSKITVREMLDIGATQVEGELAQEPAVQMRLMRVMGTAYRDLGYYDEGTRLLEGALERAKSAEGLTGETELSLKLDLAHHYVLAGNFSKAEPIQREIVAYRRATVSPDDPLLANAINDLVFGLLRSHQFTEEAMTLQQEALAIHRKAFNGAARETTSNVLMNLGWITRLRGEATDAIELLEESLEMKRTLHTSDHPSLTWILQHLAWAELAAERYADSKAHFQESLDMNRRIFGDVHPEISYNLGGIAECELRQGNADRALEIQRESIDAIRKAVGPNHFEVATTLGQLAIFCTELRNWDCAENALVEASDILTATYDADFRRRVRFMNNAGGIAWKRADLDRAERYYLEAIRIARVNQRTGRMLMIPSLNQARLLVHTGRIEEGRELSESLLASAQQNELGGEITGELQAVLGRALMETGELERSIDLLEDSLVQLAGAPNVEKWRVGVSGSILGLAYAYADRRQDADQAFSEAFQRLEAQLPPGDIERIYAMERQLRYLERFGDSDQATEIQRALNSEREMHEAS